MQVRNQANRFRSLKFVKFQEKYKDSPLALIKALVPRPSHNAFNVRQTGSKVFSRTFTVYQNIYKGQNEIIITFASQVCIKDLAKYFSGVTSYKVVVSLIGWLINLTKFYRLPHHMGEHIFSWKSVFLVNSYVALILHRKYRGIFGTLSNLYGEALCEKS